MFNVTVIRLKDVIRIILFVSIVVVLYALGVFEYILKFALLVVFIALAVFAGKKVQENEEVINRFFRKTFRGQDKDNVYYYESKDNKENKEE